MEILDYLPMPKKAWARYWYNGDYETCTHSPRDGFCKICQGYPDYQEVICTVCFRKLDAYVREGTWCKGCNKKDKCHPDHCKLCHKIVSNKVNDHWCILTNKMIIDNCVFLFKCRENQIGGLEVLQYDKDIDRLPEYIHGENNQVKMVKAYRHIRQTLRRAFHELTIKKMDEKYSPEKVLKTWALLLMIPDDNVPCRNIRPLDLISDKESLFSSCETTFKALGKEDAR